MYIAISCKGIIKFGIDPINFGGSLLWHSMPDLIKSASPDAILKKHDELEGR